MQQIDLLKSRAWVEINLDNLEHNIKEIKRILSKNIKIMAVVKANAYGCGDVVVAQKLTEIGINDFAVATLNEGIKLRENGINGNILILGFTNLEYLQYVIDYDLIQTIVDLNYSESIKQMQLKTKLKCHIKINTGMNRIGESCVDIKKLSLIYENKNLDILGTFSHLCVSDSNNIDDVKFTNMQIQNFNNCIYNLKQLGYDVGKLHIQSSYGTTNYSNFNYDYVRMGILMYGVDSTIDCYRNWNINIKPVLSLKARITSIKEICKNESIGYGRTYVAQEKRKIATVSIGYADGVPRILSNKNAKVKIKNSYASIVGRICMDQLMIDITHISDVNIGDIVTLIGDDDKISAETMALKSSSITHEILCRLGERLPRIIITKKRML